MCSTKGGRSPLLCKSMAARTTSLYSVALEASQPEENVKFLNTGYTMVLTLEGAVETTVDLHCKTLCFNQVFDDVTIFSKVLSIQDHF